MGGEPAHSAFIAGAFAGIVVIAAETIPIVIDHFMEGGESDLQPESPALSDEDWTDQGHAPEQSSPYDIRERRASDGNQEITTYDEFGNRHRQYKFDDERHGPHQHDYGPYNEEYPRPQGPRSDFLPIDE